VGGVKWIAIAILAAAQFVMALDKRAVGQVEAPSPDAVAVAGGDGLRRTRLRVPSSDRPPGGEALGYDHRAVSTTSSTTPHDP
jgi:hypothetical protein